MANKRRHKGFDYGARSPAPPTPEPEAPKVFKAPRAKANTRSKTVEAGK